MSIVSEFQDIAVNKKTLVVRVPTSAQRRLSSCVALPCPRLPLFFYFVSLSALPAPPRSPAQFVGNLDESITEEILQDAFIPFGDIVSILVPRVEQAGAAAAAAAKAGTFPRAPPPAPAACSCCVSASPPQCIPPLPP